MRFRELRPSSLWLLSVLGFLLLLLLNVSDVLSKKTSSSSSSSSSSHQKAVKVQLNAKWRQTPLYLEVAEYLAEEGPSYFWSYIEALGTSGSASGPGLATQQQQYETGLKLADKLLRSEAKLSILKFSLSLRAYSPAVAIFRQTADYLIEEQQQQQQNDEGGEKVEKDLQACDWFVELSVPETAAKDNNNFRRFNCALDELKRSLATLVEHLKTSSSKSISNPLLYSVDHIFPSSSSQSSHQATVILYADITSPVFADLHRFLVSASEEHGLRYVLRYLYPVAEDAPKVALSGYGVELAIKSTEYKAQDDTRVRGEAPSNPSLLEEKEKPDEVAGFVFSRLRTSFPASSDRLETFQNYLLDSDKEIATLKAWELQEISLQAVTRVLSVPTEEALKALREISQNFPSVARSLVKINVEEELKKEIVKNQYLFMQSLSLGTSDTALFINGLYHDVDSVDVFSLLDTVKAEASVVGKLHALLEGDAERIRKFVKLDVTTEKTDFQIDIRDGAVVYINDIEMDRMYKGWPSSLHEMLRPAYPGMLRNVRRNMYHLVLVLDPSKKESFEVLRMAESFYIHKAPVRIGLVFAVDRDAEKTGFNEAGVAALEAFNYVAQEKSPYEGLSFLTEVIANAMARGHQDLQPSDVIDHFKAKIIPHKKPEEMEDVFGADSAYDTGRQLAWEFIQRTGLGSSFPKALLNGVLLKEAHLTGDYFEDAVLTEIMKQTPPLQKAIYKGELTEDDDILDWLMSKSTVMPRLNRVILGLDKQGAGGQAKDKFVDFSGAVLKPGKKESAVDYSAANINDLQATMAAQVKYITTSSKKESTCSPVTVWFAAADFSSQNARKMLSAALHHLKANSRQMRLALIFADLRKTGSTVNRVLEAAITTLAPGGHQNALITFLQKYLLYLEENTTSKPELLISDALGLLPTEYHSAFNERLAQTALESDPIAQLHRAFSGRVLQLQPVENSNSISVVLNGKVLQVPPEEPFTEDDFSLMEKYIAGLVTDKVTELLVEKERSSGARKCSDLVLKLSAALLAKTATKTRYDVSGTISNEDHSVLVLEPRAPEEPAVELIAILDPLTRGAQKVTPLLETFHAVFNARVKVYFNAVEKHSDMPLKNYYRLVLEAEPKFDPKSNSIISPVARFNSMPRTPLLTLGMSVPENWMVEAVDALYDLDNIHLEQVTDSSVVSAVFELEHLLVEGHCFDQSSGSPPRGLQFTLGTWARPVQVDTIVMANLGYFQLKANPGIWLLRLRSGRSDELYSIVSADGADGTVNSTEVVPVVSSFRSLVLKIKVNKKPGKANEELLYDSDEERNGNNNGDDNSIWGSLSPWSSDSEKDKEKKKTSEKEEDEDSKRINVFSLATGHLYERLLRIMIKSVLTKTSTPVKFWFLKNYMSPQLKNVLPFMAARYGFQYELVQYKWPRWLHQQTEKQRIIWGYKILFLDVLFPLDVKKIIFVDADQVVRADLKELRDLDLEGAPYGYTPFCDSRSEMDGFRFWKSGYWATHLHGRKYHISALYVVDLVKFRRIAAGDRLRGQYQGLSQDPNSLSNLDQDLPNNMIHQVAIKSLPQEWLWCETWCAEETKAKAKTIDLCNNPLTKEPKLTGARRIIPEWTDYDNELREMMDEFEALQRQKEKEKVISNKSADKKSSAAKKHKDLKEERIMGTPTTGTDKHEEL